MTKPDTKEIKPVSDFYNPKDIIKFFLACEFKPNSPQKELWNIIEPFCYDIEPAYIKGIFGQIGYDPSSYAVIELSSDSDPIVGYSMSITHLDTVKLLDKIKGYYGKGVFNFHYRRLTKIYTLKEHTQGWCYILSDDVLKAYRQIEQIEYGLWHEDEKLFSLLDEMDKS